MAATGDPRLRFGANTGRDDGAPDLLAVEESGLPLPRPSDHDLVSDVSLDCMM